LEIEWLQPESVSEVTGLLAQYKDEAKLVAGGTWVTLVLNHKLLMPSAFISLQSVAGLRGIDYVPGKGLTVGALVTHREVELSPVVRQRFPVLAETFATVANIRVRNQATAGGVLCDADYASDPPATLAALNAMVTVVSARGERTIAVEDLIVGHYTTVLQPDELLTEVFIPDPPGPAYGAYLKYRTRSHEDRPCVGVAAVVQMLPDGLCRDLRVVVGAVSHSPYQVKAVLDQARGQELSQDLIAAIAEQYARDVDPIDDLRASAWYRKEMVRVFVRRAIETALIRATG
jgi:carbon-monoxide dehydrogenase medium subunit